MRDASAMLALGLPAGSAPSFTADPSQPAGGLVGVYDSRAVAYAYLWSRPVASERKALLARANEAKAAGDEAALILSQSGQATARHDSLD
jgi:hypothetical protein